MSILPRLAARLRASPKLPIDACTSGPSQPDTALQVLVNAALAPRLIVLRTKHAAQLANDQFMEIPDVLIFRKNSTT